jgi:hypothetical protein
MRSDCKLSDAELAVNDLQKARQYADLSTTFFNEFKITSQSLLVLRDVGFCYESLGNVQRRTAMDRTLSASERRDAARSSQEWYRKSIEIWVNGTDAVALHPRAKLNGARWNAC